MLHLQITIANIRYEQTLSALFPALMEQIGRREDDSLAVQLLQKVGSRSEKAVLNIIGRLDEPIKNQLLLYALQSSRQKLAQRLRDHLHQADAGLDFEDVSVGLDGGGQLFCCFHQVSVDYQKVAALLPDAMPKGLGFAAAATGFLMNLGVGDSAVYAIFKNESARRAVAAALEQMLVRNGIAADVAGCEVLRDAPVMPTEDAALSPAVLNALADAIAGYVIELIDHYESE